MADSVGWKFPPTNGGREDGFNDPGTTHFGGAPLPSLARETLQNSLDASLSDEAPVHVSFELIRLRPEAIGKSELAAALQACIRESRNDPIATAALEDAQRNINLTEIPCLRISDRNTTGLRGDQWRALVKMQGVSHKPGLEGAGGAFGIGKYAPFAVSALRTVFYWTCYREHGVETEKFQGKSVLISHQGDLGTTQGTGFYGLKESCSELTGERVPQSFRVLGKDRKPAQGTSLSIVGFRETADWRRRVASSVIENFFYAITNRTLTVIVEPDDSSELFEIDDASLGSWFDLLGARSEEVSDDPSDEGDSALREARMFWETFKDDEPSAEKQDVDLGHCRLWVRTAEGLPGKVGFVRRTGMLVTTRQRNLIRFPGFRDFLALCVFEDPAGNELLRRMENPKHDQFEPERLPESHKNRGRRALKRITDWIRSEIKKRAGPQETGSQVVLGELATYLPDYSPDEAFEDAGSNGAGASNEPGFGDRLTLSLKPVRRPARTYPSLESELTVDQSGDGEDVGEVGGEGAGSGGSNLGTFGPREGEGMGGTGGRGGGNGRPSVLVYGVRILPVSERENRYELSFRADAEGPVQLVLEEAGDSTAMHRKDVRAIGDGLSLERVVVKKGERTTIEITADAPIGDRAWRLSATANVEEQSEV